MKASRKLISALLLCALLAPSVVSCGEKQPAETSAAADTSAAGDAESTEAVTTEADPLAGIDLGGIEVRIASSADDFDSTNANALIKGSGEENGELVNDTVYARNRKVEEALNVKLAFTETLYTYSDAQTEIQKIIMSGDDIYDVVVNDLFILASLSIEGMFKNVKDPSLMDFSQSYWYDDFMKDLTIGNKAMFLLAGDYFTDVLCSSHALYFNKQLMENLYGSPDDIYQTVLDGKWTTDEFIKLIEGSYQDINGDSVKNTGDMFGYICEGHWGSAMPFAFCGDLEVVSRDADWIPTYALNNERSMKTVEMLNKIYTNKATNSELTSGDTLLPYFLSGMSLFIGYQRVGSFANFRDSSFDVGILPYPKLDEAQESYATTAHDTSEVGVIPITTTRYDATTTTLEMLSRCTAETVIPAYYETTLKVKYARDDVSSQMLDIIHDNLRGAFALAYNGYCGGTMFAYPFFNTVGEGAADFASSMAKAEPIAKEKLAAMTEAFLANNG